MRHAFFLLAIFCKNLFIFPAECLFSVSQFCASGEIILRRIRPGHYRSFIGYNVDVAVIAAGMSLFKEVEL